MATVDSYEARQEEARRLLTKASGRIASALDGAKHAAGSLAEYHGRLGSSDDLAEARSALVSCARSALEAVAAIEAYEEGLAGGDLRDPR